MELITEQTGQKLGISEILLEIRNYTVTEDGAERCARMEPFRVPDACRKELRRTAEFLELLSEEEDVPLEYPHSVTNWLEKARIEGNWLDPVEAFQISKWMKMGLALRNFFRDRKESYPDLWRMVVPIEPDKDLIKECDRILDARGNIRDDASPELRRIRRMMQTVASNLRKQLNTILREAVNNGWAEEKEITVRNGRLVIPLKADFKGRIKGFIHDISQSGQTIYLEPSAALEANNQLKSLEIEENNEIRRILIDFTARLRAQIPVLKKLAWLVSRIDFLRAKALFARRIGAVMPVLEFEGQVLDLIAARHPLLLLKAGGKKDKVVPLSLTLSPEQRIVLISGPNAGGKTVAMKTVGLCQLMLQCGLLVPCDSQSTFRWFDQLYSDIGDEQSIASDLSTYTSHLANMKTLVRAMDGKTLFLVDEFGSGTDPKMGGAMAEAFLEYFLQAGGYGIITTHYGNLKTFSDQQSGIVNAAMQFDPLNLSPTYSLEIGVPGRSYAFEIARNVGVPAEILDRAFAKMDKGEVYSEELLLKLESQKAELEQVLEENRNKNIQLKNLLERNRDLKKEIEKDQKRLLQQAHQEAQGLIREANRKIENTIREIREIQAEKERTKALRVELAEMLPEMPAQEAEEREEVYLPEALPNEIPEIGDWVMVRESDTTGKIIEMQGKRAIVESGDLRLTAKLTKLVKIRPPQHVPGSGPPSRKIDLDKKARISSELEIMGLRVEAALPVVNKFIDDALYAGLKEVRILHGKGTGALREYIRDFLKEHYPNEIISMKDAHIEMGGAGWTVISLK
ncbi:MAG: endonuclease MutS2 [Bacteroidia bacterium]|nr:endonuclease MutS2 [Bacteroidia bacterium]